ncbi:MAG: hypothetical protein EOM34_04520 [Clostridia bacterium]|nr:hypothetical protein [Clostridia bacterium]NCD04168.1 hypothetical protein [Clostridia bacterium]
MTINVTFENIEEMTNFVDFMSKKESELVKAAKKTPVKTKEEPVKEEPQPEQVEEEPVEEEPVGEAKTYSLVEVRAELSRLSKAGKRAEVQELIKSYGTEKLSDIPAEHYPELMQRAGEL